MVTLLIFVMAACHVAPVAQAVTAHAPMALQTAAPPPVQPAEPAEPEGDLPDVSPAVVEAAADDAPAGPTWLPDGFGPEDRFQTPSEACMQLVQELVPPKYRRPIYAWCEHRTWASTRHTVIESKVDGSQIHDRDRPHGWKFYANGVIRGFLTPDSCEHHRIDRSIPHPKAGRNLARNWPFGSPKMTTKMASQWMGHSHDAERFGSRGPHDNHMSTAVAYIDGCYPPEMLDRNDFGIQVTVLRSLDICETWGCDSQRDIREKWRYGGKKQKRPRHRDEPEQPVVR